MKEFELFYYPKNFIIKYNVYIEFVNYINNEIKKFFTFIKCFKIEFS